MREKTIIVTEMARESQSTSRILSYIGGFTGVNAYYAHAFHLRLRSWKVTLISSAWRPSQEFDTTERGTGPSWERLASSDGTRRRGAVIREGFGIYPGSRFPLPVSFDHRPSRPGAQAAERFPNKDEGAWFPAPWACRTRRPGTP